jgi:DNA ligase (NAD+)
MSYMSLIDLKGVTVVMTGAGPAPRGELEAQARAAGAIVQGSVSKTTQLLICESANSTSSKAEKARKLGTRVIGYAEVFPGGSTS